MLAGPGHPETVVLDGYVVHGEIAAGGMATVHLGRMLSHGARPVAIKRLHPQFAKDPEFCAMFLEEARLAARVRHPNVVEILDVAARGGELFMVMEYLHGEPLSQLIRASNHAARHIPAPIAVALLKGVLDGLHAAHEATDERGAPLSLVHRDISPQNILVGADGIARIIDFGVAKAAGRSYTTQDGRIKGKIPYMPPEQLQGERLDRRADIYAAGVVLWETLTGTRLFAGTDSIDLSRLLDPHIDPPSARSSGVPHALDQVTLCALAAERDARFPTARAMATALEASVTPASEGEVAAWVSSLAGEQLAERARQIASMSDAVGRVTAWGSGAVARHAASVRAPSAEPADALEGSDLLTTQRRPRVLVPTRGATAALMLATVTAVGALIVALMFGRSETAAPSVPSASPPATAALKPAQAALEPAQAALEPAQAAPKPAQAALEPAQAALEPAQAAPKPAQAAVPGFEAEGAEQRPLAPSAPAMAAEPVGLASAAAPAPGAPRPTPRARPARGRTARCDPPFTIDQNGHKRYKRECF